LTASGKDPFDEWFESLKEVKLEARVAARVARPAAGNFGDCKPLREGVWELRIDFGPGYRVYYAISGRTMILLLCGGDKRRQAADVERAVEFWSDYQRRTKKK